MGERINVAEETPVKEESSNTSACNSGTSQSESDVFSCDDL